MAVTVQTIQSGSKNIILNLYISGANTNAKILDILATDDNLYLVTAQWSLTGGNATLLWDATTPDKLLDMNQNWGELHVPEGEGIPNPRSAGYTNDVLLNNAAGVTSGSIYLKFRRGT